MKKIGKFTFFINLFLSYLLFAKDVQVTARVDANEVRVGESIGLEIEVNSTKASTPDLAFLEKDFQVFSQGVSTNTQIVNMSMTVSKIFSYSLIPLKKGKFNINAIEIEVDGKKYSPQTIIIRVFGGAEQKHNRQVDKEQSKAIYAQATVSKRDVYLNEQIGFTFRFYIRQGIQIQNPRLAETKFDDFWVEEDEKPKQYSKIINGISYQVIEINKVLFPQKTGKLFIPSMTLIGDILIKEKSRRRARRGFFDDSFFDDFFGSRGRLVKKSFSTKPVTINVKNLPKELSSKLVGQFDISSTLSQTNVKQGDSVTLTITIKGTGNIRDLEDPRLKETESYKVYDDKPQLNVHLNGDSVYGERIIKQAIVPIKQGEVKISPFIIEYLNPVSGVIEKKKTDELLLKVQKSNNQEILNSTSTVAGNRNERKSIQLLGKDISPIKTDIKDLKNHRVGNIFFVLFLAGIFLPGFLYLVLFFLYRQKERLHGNVSLRRRKQALKSYRKNLKFAYSKKTVEAVEVLLKDFLANVLNVNGMATTVEEFKRIFEREKLDKSSIAKIVSALERFEAAKFGALSISESDITAEIKIIEEIVKIIKKRFRL